MKKSLLLGVILPIAAFAVGALGMAPSTALAQTLPTVTEIPDGVGIHGYPFGAVPTVSYFPGAPVFDLDAVGYAEREFLVSGTANTYRQYGFWTSNGRWRVRVSQRNLPYTTRILVRYPTDPSKFNGTVVFEWLNETTGVSASPDWSESYEYFLNHGYAYVGVTAQNGEAGPNFLRLWDPVRYGQLFILTDGQSYDIYTQVAQVVAAKASQILGGLTPTTLLAGGDSQAALRLTTYVNAIHPMARVFDGFILHGRASVGAPLGDGLTTLYPIAPIRTDNTTPVIQILAEGDLVQETFTLARQADNRYLRTWEVAGAAHIDLYEGAYELAIHRRDVPYFPDPVCVYGDTNPNTGGGLLTRLPYHRIEKVAWHRLNQWATTGTPPPSAPPISTNFFGVIRRDQYGNARGGVRLPELDVPTSTYYYWNVGADVASALVCTLGGFDEPFDSATLRRLYPTHEAYVSEYTEAADELLDEGFLVQQDYEAAIEGAENAPIP